MYDDHMYCGECDKHARNCWCRIRGDDDKLIDPLTERDCSGGKGHDGHGEIDDDGVLPAVVFPEYNQAADGYRVVVAPDDESVHDGRNVIEAGISDEADAIALARRVAAEYSFRYVDKWGS